MAERRQLSQTRGSRKDAYGIAAVYITKLDINKTINAFECLPMHFNDACINIIFNIPHNFSALESRLQLKCVLTYKSHRERNFLTGYKGFPFIYFVSLCVCGCAWMSRCSQR